MKGYRKFPVLFFAAFFIIAAFPPFAHAATYYVATNGSDSKPGTAAAPWRTWKYSFTQLKAGDTLLVRGGTYRETLESHRGTDFPSGTSWDNAVTIKEYQGEQATLNGAMSIGREDPLTQYLIFDGISFDGKGIGELSPINVNGGANHIRFINGEIKNSVSTAGAGVGDHNSPTPGQPTFVEFINMDVYNNGMDPAYYTAVHRAMHRHGFYLQASGILVENSRIHDNGGCGIHQNVHDRVKDNIYRNNKVWNNGHCGIIVTGSDNVLVYNNVVWDNLDGASTGIAVSTIKDPKGTKVFNNTVYNHRKAIGISVEGPLWGNKGAFDTQVFNNISYNNAIDFKDEGTNTTQGNNLFGIDPKFKDAANADFHLTAASVDAIDKGVTLSVVNNDFDYGARPFGAAYDIGAFEFGAPPGTTPGTTTTGGSGSSENCTPGGAGSSGGSMADGFVPPAAAKTYYVATAGSDSNDGSEAAPFKTLQKAINTVQGGDTVLVRAGVYAGFLAKDLNPPAGQWITLKPYPGEKATIDTGKYLVALNGVSYLVIEGFEITNKSYNYSRPFSCDLVKDAKCLADAKKFSGNFPSQGITIAETRNGNAKTLSNHIIILNNEIHHNASHGMLGHLVDSEILDNDIHHNGYGGWTGGYGTYIEGENLLVRGNIVHENSGNNIRLGNTPPDLNLVNSIVEKNIVYNALGPFIHGGTGVTYGAGIVVFGGDGNIIRNNIAYNNSTTPRNSRLADGSLMSGGPGFQITTVGKPDLVYNNTSYGNGLNGFFLQGPAIAKNNISFNNGQRIPAYEFFLTGNSRAENNLMGGNPNGLNIDLRGGTEAGNIKNVDPLFANAAGGDFHLQSAASPAVDKGVTLSEVANDFDLGPRPYPSGGDYDIGAFEFGAPPGTTPGGGSAGGGGSCSAGPPQFYAGSATITWGECDACDEANSSGIPAGDDGNNGHGNDPGGVDPSNPGRGGISAKYTPPAGATIYYTATTGNNSNTCAAATNPATAKKTIQEGMKCLGAGDVLEVKGGTYSESIFNNSQNLFPDGTGPDNMTVIRGAAGEKVIWTNQGGSPFFTMKNGGSYVRFENFEFDASKLSATDGGAAWKHFRQDGKITVGTQFVNNIMHDAPDHGVFNGSDTSGWLIEGNTVYNSGTNSNTSSDAARLANNFYLEGNNHVVRGNVAYYTRDMSGLNSGNIRLGNNTGDGHGANNNIIENNFTSGGQGGIIMGTGDNNIARNNIVTNTDRVSWAAGILFWTQGNWSHNGNKIYNNTIYNAPNCISTMANAAIPTNTEVKNNILSNCTRNAINDPGNLFTLLNNLTSNPKFKNAAAGDFHLTAGSPAIDAGALLSDVPKDFDYGDRPFGAAHDIGAYEYGAPPGVPPATIPPVTGGTGGTTGEICTPGASAGAGPPIIPPNDLHAVTPGGASYYIATNGSDSNNGSINAPWKTLKYALTRMQGGDAVYFRAGTYSGTGYSAGSGMIPSGTSWNNATTIAAYQGEAVTLKPSGESPLVGTYTICGFNLNGWQYKKTADQYILFKDFILDGINCGDNGFYFYGGMKVAKEFGSAAEAHHIRLQNLDIKNFARMGFAGGGNAMEFINIGVHHNGMNPSISQWNGQAISRGAHGIYWWGHDSLFDGLDIYQNGGLAIQFNDSNPGMHNDRNVFRNNRLHANGQAYAQGLVTTSNGAGLAIDGDNNLVYNNIFYDAPAGMNGGIGIGYDPGNHNNKIYNNVFYNLAGAGINLGAFAATTGTLVKNNIFYKTQGAVREYGGASGTMMENNLIDTDPGFVNPGAGDFRIALQTSPAVDKGTALGEVQFDFDRKNRPMGAAYDIGAYEYDGPPGTAPPVPAGGTCTPAPVPVDPCAPPVSRSVCGNVPTGIMKGSDSARNNAILEKWIPTILCMTGEFSVAMMDQVGMVGALFDAEQQLETQRLNQKKTAEAHKDYHPSTQMCTIGTNVRSLAGSEEYGRANADVIAAALMRRETLAKGTAGATGISGDKKARIEKFLSTYCDPADNNGALKSICKASGAQSRPNSDISYPQTLDARLTLDLDFVKGGANKSSADEEDVLALANNLYANDLFPNIPEDRLKKATTWDEWQEMRSIHAMRSVAFNSYANLAGMRAAEPGTPVAPYMESIILQMGGTHEDAVALLGKNPSYFAQMEVLTKNLYQSPEFFTNLYDKPENVERIGASIEALKLMQDRDRFESALRREMLISLILELKLREAQHGVDNRILNTLSTKYPD